MAQENNNHFKVVINWIFNNVVGLQVIVRCFEKVNVLFKVRFSLCAAIQTPLSV